MDYCESHHGENEFYYPDEADKERLNEEILPNFTLTDVQNFILGQRPANTVKKEINRLFNGLGCVRIGRTWGHGLALRQF